MSERIDLTDATGFVTRCVLAILEHVYDGYDVHLMTIIPQGDRNANPRQFNIKVHAFFFHKGRAELGIKRIDLEIYKRSDQDSAFGSGYNRARAIVENGPLNLEIALDARGVMSIQ